MLFYVSIYAGKTYNCYIEADSKNDILNFYNTFSHAKVLNIKRVVYSKEFNINHSGAFAPLLIDCDKELKILAKTKKNTNVLVIKFPKKNLKIDTVKKALFNKICFNNEPINHIYSVMRS